MNATVNILGGFVEIPEQKSGDGNEEDPESQQPKVSNKQRAHIVGIAWFLISRGTFLIVLSKIVQEIMAVYLVC